MNEKDGFYYLKSVGCCDYCCLRYLGVRNPGAYEKIEEYVDRFKDPPISETEPPPESDAPPSKRVKLSTCISCLGVLQKDCWQECFQKVKDELGRKSYECNTFACALSSPMVLLLREKYVTLLLQEKFPENADSVDPTSLKEAWKWSFAAYLAEEIGKTLDSGSISPLLVTLHMEYDDESKELEPLKKVAPNLFESRFSQKRRFTVEFTRRCVEQAIDGATLHTLKEEYNDLFTNECKVKCTKVVCEHAPLLLGGRYIKLSRELSQSPWIIAGKRMMESSVQEIIFEPIAHLYGIPKDNMEGRLKFISAGREDVDVRCLGDGRPFAIEITDPTREPTERELNEICKSISKDGRIQVKQLCVVGKDDLTILKQGEETKSKTYEALCIKLTHSKHEASEDRKSEIKVTEKDIENMNTFKNIPQGEVGKIAVIQKTPIRVLHRRPLLNRKRKILELKAELIEGHPQLFKIKMQTEAGTYVKEWVHGELKRNKPSLSDALGAKVDILALDVTQVHLDWPLKK